MKTNDNLKNTSNLGSEVSIGDVNMLICISNLPRP